MQIRLLEQHYDNTVLLFELHSKLPVLEQQVQFEFRLVSRMDKLYDSDSNEL